MFCANCGKEVDDKAVICVHCGCAIKTIKNEQDKSWLAALLLCFFFGLLGVHRFYVGKIGSGVAQLLLTITFFGAIISGIWVLIDFIVILCGNFKTKDGNELTK